MAHSPQRLKKLKKRPQLEVLQPRPTPTSVPRPVATPTPRSRAAAGFDTIAGSAIPSTQMRKLFRQTAADLNKAFTFDFNHRPKTVQRPLTEVSPLPEFVNKFLGFDPGSVIRRGLERGITPVFGVDLTLLDKTLKQSGVTPAGLKTLTERAKGGSIPAAESLIRLERNYQRLVQPEEEKRFIRALPRQGQAVARTAIVARGIGRSVRGFFGTGRRAPPIQQGAPGMSVIRPTPTPTATPTPPTSPKRRKKLNRFTSLAGPLRG